MGQIVQEQEDEGFQHRESLQTADAARRQFGVPEAAPSAQHLQEDPARLLVGMGVAGAGGEVDLGQDLDRPAAPCREDPDVVRCAEFPTGSVEAEHRAVVAVSVLLVGPREGDQAVPFSVVESELLAVDLVVLAENGG